MYKDPLRVEIRSSKTSGLEERLCHCCHHKHYYTMPYDINVLSFHCQTELKRLIKELSSTKLWNNVRVEEEVPPSEYKQMEA